MAKKKTKQDFVDELVRKRKEILGNSNAKISLVDALVPLSSFNGEIIDFGDDGRVTIKFSAPIDAYIDYMTLKKIKAILDEVDNPDPKQMPS